MKENEDNNEGRPLNRLPWQVIETRLSVAWLVIRIIGALVAVGAAAVGISLT